MSGPVGDGRAAIDRAMPEKEFMARVIRLARLHGYLAYHPFDSRHGEAGYPDLTLAHPVKRRVIFVETKREGGRLTDAQMAWRDALLRAGAEWYCWRPSDFDALADILAGEREG